MEKRSGQAYLRKLEKFILVFPVACYDQVLKHEILYSFS